MFESTHILTGEILYRRAFDSVSQWQAKVDDLRLKQEWFARLDVVERTALLMTLAQRLANSKHDLAKMVCEEVGRCWRECEAELDKSIELIRYYARLAPEFLADKTIATQASFSRVSFEPFGVVLAVMPWNYPIWQILRFAIPALCAGNACLIKPAPTVARVSAALFELVGEELPFEVVWLAETDIEEAIAACDALAFTGSTQTGRYLAGLAGKHIKKCVLELGGSNPFLVLPDADLVQAARDACYSRFRDAGQSCNAAKRLIVCEQIAEPFIALFLAECAKLRLGNPMLPETTLASMHRADLRRRLHEQVMDAVANGATLLCGGEWLDWEQGFFYPATVLDGLNERCRMWHEEVFGPAIGIIRVADVDEAVSVANATVFGLGASVYTQNMHLARSLADRLVAGSVFVNRHTSSDLRLPFGGVKDSGFGRELSEFGLYEFVNVKTYWQR